MLNYAKTPMPPSPSFSPTPVPSGTTPIPLTSPRLINSTPAFPYLPTVDDREEEEEEEGAKQQGIASAKNKRKARKTKGRKGNEDEEDEEYVERGTRGRRGRGGKRGGQTRGRRGRRPAVRDESTMQSPTTPSTIYTPNQVKSPPQQSIGMDLNDNSMVSISGKVSPSIQHSMMAFEPNDHEIHPNPLIDPFSRFSLQNAVEDAEKRQQKYEMIMIMIINRLARNRESARQSRKRRKDHQTLLDQTVAETIKELSTERMKYLRAIDESYNSLLRREIENSTMDVGNVIVDDGCCCCCC